MALFDDTFLRGGWLHSHEEDTPGRTVFRASTQSLPAARGRRGYDFQPDGKVTLVASGPTDRTTVAEGSWSIDADGRITIRMPGAPADQVLEVLSLDKDRLVVTSNSNP